jgi:transcriptional regulator with XRE-family HTH domain
MDTPVLPASEFQKDAGLRLRRLLQMLDLKQTEAAALMGVTKHVLRNWLAGDNPVQPYPLYRLCRIKGVDFNYVYLGIWDGLPHRLAKELEEEALAGLQSTLGAERAEANQAAEN